MHFSAAHACIWRRQTRGTRGRQGRDRAERRSSVSKIPSVGHPASRNRLRWTSVLFQDRWELGNWSTPRCAQLSRNDAPRAQPFEAGR
jgi:hypothetical protein